MDNYVVITPAHNEEEYILYTLDSVVAQTIQPVQWVIVDDGSTDDTSKIIQEYVERYDWIKLIRTNPNEKTRKGGAKVVRAFNHGYDALEIDNYNFIVKLDADLTIPPNYFERVGQIFSLEPQVGMCGGTLSAIENGVWKTEKTASYHLRGAFKAYRKKCFDQIGGLIPTLRWESLDEMKAMSLGWRVKILPIEVKHHRRSSTLINRGIKFSYIIGKKHYQHGYDLFLAILRSIVVGFSTKPYILSSIVFLIGFMISLSKKEEKEVDPELERFIRKFQYNRIKKFLGINNKR